MNIFQVFPILSFLILSSLISVRIIYLKRNGIQVFSGSAKIAKTKFLNYPVFLLIMSVWVFELAKPFFPVPFSILPEIFTNLIIVSFLLKFLGVLVIILSLVFLHFTLLHFKNSLRFGLNKNNRGELITTGIFSVSRNPFFLSLDTYFIGIAILIPNLFFIGFAVSALVSIHFFILKEEKFMKKVYGVEYEDYQLKARRYF